MCLAIPVKVTELIAEGMARVELDGVAKDVSLALVDGVAVGDYLILHAGFALTKLDAEEAERSLALFREMAEAAGLEPQ